MLMDLRDDCKIGHLELRCSGQILYEVDLPNAIEFFLKDEIKRFQGRSPQKVHAM